MLQLSLLLLFVLDASTTPIGCIFNVTFVSPDSATIFNNFTLEQCFCESYLRNFLGFNYLMNNQSCQLFINFTANYALVVNTRSQFCFTVQPPIAQSQETTAALNPTTETTTFMSPLTTSAPSLQWNPVAVTVASGYGNASVLNPYAVFVDDNYFMYIAEKGNSRVSKWPPNPNGTFSTALWRTNVGELNAPPSLYVDSATDDVYVADESNHRIRYFANGSTVGVSIASPTAGTTPNVNAVFLDPNRTIFVTDSSNNRIYNWLTNATAAGGNGLGSNASQFNQPKRFFIDKNFTFYVPDSTNERVQKWMPNVSAGQTVAGGNGLGSGPSQLSGPLGTVVDSQGNVLVCDSGNNRVQKWAPNATVGQTVAGSASGVSGSGPDQLTSPHGIAIDKDDNLYVVDGSISYRIQKFSVV